MTTSADYKGYPLEKAIRQSGPIDFSVPYDPATLKNKTILITGGASGFGAGFARRWAGYGATVIIGDISVAAAEKLVAELRTEAKNPNVHFVYCNVTEWKSQVNFFKESVKLSPHGGIDMVVANAGVAIPDTFERPGKLDADEPPPPNLVTVEVNLTGVLYTAHLAIYYLPKNPQSKPCDPSVAPTSRPRDRHLLLLGSMASLGPVPTQPLYAVSKHGVLGLFRSLRATSFFHGIRVNLLCPYFIDTPIVPAPLRVILAGGGMGKPEEVVEGGTRFAADSRIAGRSMYIGPKMDAVQDADGEWHITKEHLKDNKGENMAIWEAYAHDFEDSELFGRKIIRLLNELTAVRGWAGWFADLCSAVVYTVKNGKKALLGNVQTKSKTN